MTAPTRTTLVIFDSSVNPGDTNKASAMAASTPADGNGGWKDISAYNGGDLGWAISNTGSSPSTPLIFTVQFASAAGVAKGSFDRWTASGDTIANGGYSGLIPIPSSVKFVRVLAYGNQTNTVDLYVEAMLKA